jgi:hypothetical protein
MQIIFLNTWWIFDDFEARFEPWKSAHKCLWIINSVYFAFAIVKNFGEVLWMQGVIE